MFSELQREFVETAIASSTPFEPADDSLLKRFDTYFKTLSARTPEQIRTAQEIRYQVYCIENPHEKITNPFGLETDEFDSHALQGLLVYPATAAALGTVRLILPVPGEPEHSFAVQRVMGAAALKEFGKLPLNCLAEISRFSLSRQFRRMLNAVDCQDQSFLSNSGPLMRLGIMQALVRISVESGITHWCAMMEPTLMRMLAAMAIRFRPIGPAVEFHGLRQPCHGSVFDILDAVRRERPAFWSVLTDGGSLLAGNPRVDHGVYG